MNKYDVVITSIFKKQLKIIKKRNKSIKKLNKIVALLAQDQPLPLKYKDHMLEDTKQYRGCRECHIEPNWLLIYKKEKTTLILVLVQMGSHSDLF